MRVGGRPCYTRRMNKHSQHPLALVRNALRALVTLVAAIITFLTFLRPPTGLFWYLRLGVTEWGYWLAPLIIVPLVRPLRRAFGWAAWPIGLAALVAQLPLLQALFIARALPGQLTAAFGPGAVGSTGRPAPFVVTDVVMGMAAPPASFKRLAYSAPAGQELYLDLYLPPAAPTPAPLVVVIHGGSWQGGDSQQLPALNAYLVARGYAVAAVEYRLAPQNRFPAARDDVVAALDFLTQHAGEYRIDANRMVLLGRSAGAQLALLVGYTVQRPAIRGVVSFYGPTDLVWGYNHPANPLVLESRPLLEAYLGGTPDQLPDAYSAASPIDHVDANSPPTLLIHGANDEMVFVENSQRLAVRLTAAQRPHLLVTLPCASHGCDANLQGPSGQISTYAIERFLGAVFATPS